MKIINGALVREQNENDVDDSCFDSSEYQHMCQKLNWQFPCHEELKLEQFVDEIGNLQRHPQTKFPNDISSDQAHMYYLATKRACLNGSMVRTSNGDLISVGFFASINQLQWLSNLSLLFQIILFWIPIRWCDGNNPTIRIGFIKLNLGYRHHAGDYRLFKQCLYYAPVWIKRLVNKKTLKKMTRYYWYGEKWSPGKVIQYEDKKEPNVDWLIEIDDRYVEECL